MRVGIPFSLIVATTLCLAGCTAKEARDDTIKGQVFIVTKSRENVKLGLVTVVLFPESVVVKHVAMKRSELEAKRKAYQPQIESAQAEYDAASKRAANSALRAKTAAAAEEAATRRFAASKNSEEIDRNIDTMQAAQRGAWPAEKRAVADRQKAAAALALLAGLRDHAEDFDCGTFYLEGLPQALATAQTDANGEFDLRIPHKGRFVLAASAQRQVLDKSEDYCWIVLIPEEARRGIKLLLSNETLTTAGSSLALVHTAK